MCLKLDFMQSRLADTTEGPDRNLSHHTACLAMQGWTLLRLYSNSYSVHMLTSS
jgi:hypothetical protein